MPSFDIVSRVDLAEVDNALAGINREIATRFDFKGSKCAVERKEGEIAVVADDDLKLKQMHELIKVHLTRRKVEPGSLDYQKPEKAAGNTLRQTIALRQGIDATLARQLVREIKEMQDIGRPVLKNKPHIVSPCRSLDVIRSIIVLSTISNENPH